jgi:hypothetical protein
VERSKLTPIDDVAAIPPSLTHEMSAERTIEPEGSEGFLANGWRFIQDDVDHPGLRAVFRDSAGHLSIEGATVVIRFDDDADEGQINEVLRRHRLAVRRQVTFLPKGYQVIPEQRPAKGQLLRISAELEKLDCVRYADPDFIEELGAR